MEEARVLHLLLAQQRSSPCAGPQRADCGARLAAVLSRMKGSAREISGVFHDRDNKATRWY